MNKVVRKLFMNPLNEEKWINAMAENGYALVDVSWLRYEFEKTSKKKYLYRIELLEKDAKSMESENYVAFLDQIGVELVSTYMTWAYFRKISDGMSFDIYSDTKSKIAYYGRLEKFWLSLSVAEMVIGISTLPLNMILLISGQTRLPMPMLIGITILAGLCLIIGIFMLLFSYLPIRNIRMRLENEGFLYE